MNMLKNPEKTKNEIVSWIQKYFEENGFKDICI